MLLDASQVCSLRSPTPSAYGNLSVGQCRRDVLNIPLRWDDLLSSMLNIQADAVTWVKDAVKTRREMRRTRRGRKTPCRKPRFNRAKGSLAPSTKARWQWKLRICWWLKKIFPVTDFVVEDIAAVTKKGSVDGINHFLPWKLGKNGRLPSTRRVLLRT